MSDEPRYPRTTSSAPTGVDFDFSKQLDIMYRMGREHGRSEALDVLWNVLVMTEENRLITALVAYDRCRKAIKELKP